MKICYLTTDFDYVIKLEQAGADSFRVTYGLQVKSDLTYGQAASELGACIMHALALAGKLDNREANEARLAISYDRYFDRMENANKIPLSFEAWIKAGKPD